MIPRLFFELQYLLQKTPWDTGVSPPELLGYLDTIPPGRAIDLGCGTGTNALTIAHYGWDVTGIDISTRAIRSAQRKLKSTGLHVRFLQGDVTQLKGVNGDFDLVLDIGCFHSLTPPSRKRYAENLRKILRPGGTFLLYTWLQPPSNDHSPALTEETIRELIQAYCEILHVSYGSDSARHYPSAWITMRRIP
jgi:SAM-dependent methyltransferase